jgi:hypothetical protein
VAGRVDQPTYYPGVEDMSGGKVIPIAAGAVNSGIDFVLQDASIGRAESINPFLAVRLSDPTTQLVIPVRITVDGGGKAPVSAGGSLTRLVFTDRPIGLGYDIGLPVSVTASTVALITAPGLQSEFHVMVESLPNDYVVKSMMYGSVDLTKSGIRFTVPTLTPTTSTTPISVVLTPVRTNPAPGVSVSGRLSDASLRLIYISGKPGEYYSDGTFVVRGVPPGRHTVIAVGAATMASTAVSPPFVASVVVGDSDVEGLGLERTEVLPAFFKSPSLPRPVGGHPAGAAVPLASIMGSIAEGVSGEPIKAGTLTVVGASRTEVPIMDGKFQIPNLLPGQYSLQMSFPHLNETVIVDDKNLNLDLTAVPGP